MVSSIGIDSITLIDDANAAFFFAVAIFQLLLASCLRSKDVALVYSMIKHMIIFTVNKINLSNPHIENFI
jgi:hypothetical protein